MSSLSSESTISHYRIKELLGRGGMGEVYKAVDIQLGRMVALKTLRAANVADEDAQRRFLREARAASILSHPSICTIFEVGQENGLDFIAMQLVQGSTLQRMLLQGPLAIESAIWYSLDIADALEEAHKNGVIHRDIKPSNIIVNERGVAVVLDFGLAKQILGSQSQDEDVPTLLQVSTATTIAGTIPYMSPEQVRGEALDQRSDIFSFGVTLYEMLTGRLPFNGQTNIDVLHAILHDEPQPVSDSTPETDVEINLIIAKAMKKHPADRYQTIAEMRSDLTLFAQKRGIVVRGVSSSFAGPISAAGTRIVPSAVSSGAQAGRGWRLSRFSTRRYIAAFSVAAVVLAAALWFLFGLQTGSEIDTSSLQTIQLADWKSDAGEGYFGGKFSHDGKKIAFASTKDGGRHIWLAQTGDKSTFRLTSGDSHDRNAIWSPDDQRLAFVSKRQRQFGLWTVSAIGGPPKSVAILGPDVRLLRWAKDSRAIYCLSQNSIFTVDADSGRESKITQIDSFDNESQFVSLSPDEQRVVFVGSKNQQQDVWVLPLRGGDPIQLTDDPAEDRDVLWHPDGKRVIYSSDRNGTYQLFVGYLDGRKPQQITFGANDSLVTDVSHDGSKILYATTREESDIWRVNTATGDETAITSDLALEIWPDVAPDGKSITFQASKQSQAMLTDSSIVAKRVMPEGSELPIVTNAQEPIWSPEGTRIAFRRFANDKMNIWTARASGGDERQLTNREVWPISFSLLPYNRSQVSTFAWSPDGSKIIHPTGPFASNIWIVNVDDQGETKVLSEDISNTTIYCPFWSPDGGRIAYFSEPFEISPGETRTWTVRITTLQSGETREIFQSDSVLRLLGWSESGNELIVALQDKSTVADDKEVTLIKISTEGQQREIARLSSTYLYNIRISPDKRAVAFVSRQNGKDNIWLISITGGKAKMLTANIDPKLYFSSIAWSPDGKALYFGKQSRYNLLMMLDNLK
jgi:serine/threonine protein kinase